VLSPARDNPLVMGVLNVTPDSFSDGGRFLEVDAAVAHARELAADGAAIVDVGGESTRPGARPVSVDEELRRVIPVVERIAVEGHAVVCVDTRKHEVAEAALQAGARIVNDVSAFRAAPEMAHLVAASGASCCLMHMRGEPATMQDDPRYEDVVSEVARFLEQRLAFAVGQGVPEERVWLDPGIGFGKTLEHNLELLRRLDEIAALGRPVVVGASRKGFLGRLIGRSEREREAATVATTVLAYERGASVFRVHEPRGSVDALAVARAALAAR
jgi:dihydropteroate synthase